MLPQKRIKFFLPDLASRQGITFVEVLTALVIIAAAFGVFYGVFVMNWMALEGYIVRTQLWDEASTIIRKLTEDGRFSKTIEIVELSDGNKTVRFFDRSGEQVAVYTITADGSLQRTEGANSSLLSKNIQFGESTFEKDGPALKVKLSLQEQVITRRIRISTENEVFPRNYLN